MEPIDRPNEGHDKQALTNLEKRNSHYRALVIEVLALNGTMNDIHALLQQYIAEGHPAYRNINASQFPLRRIQAREAIVRKYQNLSYDMYLKSISQYPPFLDEPSKNKVFEYFEQKNLVQSWPYLPAVAPKIYALLRRLIASGEPYRTLFIPLALRHLLPDNPYMKGPHPGRLPRPAYTAFRRALQKDIFQTPQNIMQLIESRFTAQELTNAENDLKITEKEFLDLVRASFRLKAPWMTPTIRRMVQNAVKDGTTAEDLLRTMIRHDPALTTVPIQELKAILLDTVERKDGKRTVRKRA